MKDPKEIINEWWRITKFVGHDSILSLIESVQADARIEIYQWETHYRKRAEEFAGEADGLQKQLDNATKYATEFFTTRGYAYEELEKIRPERDDYRDTLRAVQIDAIRCTDSSSHQYVITPSALEKVIYVLIRYKPAGTMDEG